MATLVEGIKECLVILCFGIGFFDQLWKILVKV